MIDLPDGLRAMLAEPEWTRDHVHVLADWYERAGDAAADGVRHAIAWARRLGVDTHGLWGEARLGRSTCLMRWIPAGRGVLGAPLHEPGRLANEPVQRTVRLRSGFWMSATLVTEGQYAAVMPAEMWPQRGAWPGHGADHPMVAIERRAVQLFLRRENANRQHPLRLPTHAEWEYAARAGTVWPTGLAPGQPLTRYAWVGQPRRRAPHPVARKAPNPWGLYDMLGNVQEWCADLLAGAESPGRQCWIRGASWLADPARVRIAARAPAQISRAELTTGFRLVLGPATTFE